jgi:RNA:NAD 2'-phosphotransferase (TPT1/KptA family)
MKLIELIGEHNKYYLPEYLYHGTFSNAFVDIEQKGLITNIKTKQSSLSSDYIYRLCMR